MHQPYRAPAQPRLLLSSSVAAILTLLAACGGGTGSGGSAVSEALASSQPSTTQTLALTTADSASSTGASQTASDMAPTTSTTTGISSTVFTEAAVADNSGTTAQPLGVTTTATVQLVSLVATTSTASTTATTTSSGSTPYIFNAPQSTRAGDVISIQGHNFGTSPVVKMVSRNGDVLSTLPLLDAYGTGLLSVKIPTTATGAVILKVNNGTQDSAAVALNGARADHLDTFQISAKLPFRVFGRNLLVSGYSPVVTVDGVIATVDVKNSNEHMLSVVAPATIKASARAAITVDNGNGTGSTTFDRPVETLAGSSDPFMLGTGWASAFAELSTRVISSSTDVLLPKKVVCDGSTDITAALQSAIDLAVSRGGGVVQLPSGTCKLSGMVKLKSKVVIQGLGKNSTIINYDASYPFYGKGIDLVGIRDLTLSNVKGDIESPLIQDSQRVFIKNSNFNLNGGDQMYWSGNTNFVVIGTTITQPKNTKQYAPLIMNAGAGLVFTGNTITFAHGAPSFARVHDAYVADNRFTRDIRDNQDGTSVVHSFVMDFAYRIAVIGNSFDVLGGPVTNKFRNDGEGIISEGGGGKRTENLGTVGSATSISLTDTTNVINVNPFTAGVIPENYAVAIVAGRGAGQTRRVISYASGTLLVDKAWDVIPDTTSRYATFVWGLEKAILKKNSFLQVPRGIWLYQTAARDIDIVENNISEGGGIYVRAAQKLTAKLFDPMYGIRIANNTISNTRKEWRSYLSVMFQRMEETDFGIGMIGVEVRGNALRANNPNISQPQELAGNIEGYAVKMQGEGATQALSKDQERILGSILQSNSCTDCQTAYLLSDGVKLQVQDTNLVLSSTSSN
jgi:hypothetical protein